MENEYFFSLAERLNSVQDKLHPKHVDLSMKTLRKKITLCPDSMVSKEELIKHCKKHMINEVLSGLTEEQLSFAHTLKFKHEIKSEFDCYVMQITLYLEFLQVNNQ